MPPSLLGTSGPLTTAGHLMLRVSPGGQIEAYDARSGELLRRVSSGNLEIHTLHAPWGGGR